MRNKMYQVSTLQALALGYTREVIKVKEFMEYGNIGLGTFEDVNGEMIVVDGNCYRADEKGHVTKADPDDGVPFAVITTCEGDRNLFIEDIPNIDRLKKWLNQYIDNHFTLNSMHIARIDGEFDIIKARSESGLHTHHVELKELLKDRQKDFTFENIEGSIVAVYFPDYMDGINAAGWHLHFISKDKTCGGHIFDISAKSLTGRIETISCLEMLLPESPAYDTYALKSANANDIKAVEQGNKK